MGVQLRGCARTQTAKMLEEKIARQIETIAIPLGPYRNLTTLVASVVATHPQCLALNHAAGRVFAESQLDFFSVGSVDLFVRAAIKLSQTGARGKHGGDIRLSHAFDDRTIGELYLRYKGDRVLSPEARCLFWKDSMHITNHIVTLGLRPETVAANDARLRFILPIRNPLDCAQANLRNKFRFLTESQTPTKLELLQRILRLVRDISDCAAGLPCSFFIFTQSEMVQDFWSKLCEFLKVDCREDWLADVSRTVKVRPGYAHSGEETAAYRDLVLSEFDDRAGDARSPFGPCLGTHEIGRCRPAPRRADMSCLPDAKGQEGLVLTQVTTGSRELTFEDCPRRRRWLLFVGPAKTGTSWLDQVLRGVDGVCLPDKVKETFFFDKHFDKGVQWYLEQFPQDRSGDLMIEVAPTYFFSDAVPDRIVETIPEAQIVVSLRDPVRRAVSHYLNLTKVWLHGPRHRGRARDVSQYHTSQPLRRASR